VFCVCFCFGVFSLNLYVSVVVVVVVVDSGLSTMQTQIGNSTLSQKKTPIFF
jgi:hypothetical protein